MLDNQLIYYIVVFMKRKEVKCKHCHEQIKTRAKSFCSNKCQAELKQKSCLEKWLNGDMKSHNGKTFQVKPFVRRYLIEKSNYKCSECGWGERNQASGNVPLEIDHINGIASDGSISNLRVLCPNCHSLTSTFRNLNKVKGIRDRK